MSVKPQTGGNPYKGTTSTGAKAASPTDDSGEQSVQRFRPWSRHQVQRLTWVNSKTPPANAFLQAGDAGVQAHLVGHLGGELGHRELSGPMDEALSVCACGPMDEALSVCACGSMDEALSVCAWLPVAQVSEPFLPAPISLSLSCPPPPQGLLWGVPFPFATGWRGHLSLVVASLPHPLVRGPLNADAEAGFLRVAAAPAVHPGPPRLSAILSWPQLQS